MKPIHETHHVKAERMRYTPPAASSSVLVSVANLIKEPDARSVVPRHGAKILCRLPGGQIYYESGLAVDTDGSRFAKHDRTGNSATAWQPGGHAVDADNVPYFSVTIPTFNDARLRLRKGDFAVVIHGTTVAFAVLADVGGAHLGEGSLELHRELGHERVVLPGTKHERFINAGIDKQVITIAFPHSGNPAASMPTKDSIRIAAGALWLGLSFALGVQNLVTSVRGVF